MHKCLHTLGSMLTRYAKSISLAPARQHPQANAASTSSTDPQALSSHNRSHRPLFTPLTHPDPPDPDTRLTPDYDLKCTFSALSLPFTASATLSCRRRRSGGAEQLCRKRSLTPEGYDLGPERLQLTLAHHVALLPRVKLPLLRGELSRPRQRRLIQVVLDESVHLCAKPRGLRPALHPCARPSCNPYARGFLA